MDITQYAVDKETLRVLYRFEIARFFEIHEPLTEQECIQYAARFVGEPVAPTPIQAHQRYGQQSYTVTAGAEPTRIVQFRRPPLDMELMRLARETYGRFVPKVDFIERLPDTAVFAYEADLVAGEAFSIAGCQLLNNDNYRLLDQTVKDFAEYAPHNPPELILSNHVPSDSLPWAGGTQPAPPLRILRPCHMMFARSAFISSSTPFPADSMTKFSWPSTNWTIYSPLATLESSTTSTFKGRIYTSTQLPDM